MATEIELKLRIAAADIPRLKRHPAIKALLTEKPKTRRLVSIYYDTPALTLLDQHITLRVRRMSGGWFQAVKGGGSSLAGLHQRMEWEDVIASGHPDYTKIANITDPTLAALFASSELRAALKPIFTTDMQRTEWQLAYPGGTHIELALDVGHVVIDGEKREAISEIELEMKAGSPSHLFELALQLQADIPLHLENVSKAQRGYAYYRSQPLCVKKASPTQLNQNADAVAAFRQIAWECIAQLQGNQDMVLHGDDIEGVHQMRVALRRLRSLFAVFSAVINPESSAGLIAEIRWISEVLGKARDLDVFLTETLPPMFTPLLQHPGLLLLRDKAIQAQTEAYVELRAAIHAQRYQRLQLALGAWLEQDAWQTQETTTMSAQAVAAAVLNKRYKQLNRHGQRLVHMHPEERHQARISAKKLRYAAEFFTSLSPANSAKRFIRALAEVQNVLGVLNDIATTETLIHNLAGVHPNRPLDEALHLFSGWNACNSAHHLQQMSDKWKAFTSQTPFWR